MIRAFTQAGAAVVVDAPEDDVRWLEEFLRPAFEVADARAPIAPGAPVVRLRAGGMPPDGVERQGDLVVFALDSGPVRLPASAMEGGTRFQDAAFRVAFDVHDDGRATTVRCAPEDRRFGRLALMRVVREHAHNHALQHGGVVLHAAAVVARGGALAVAGPRTAGKTTLLVRLLAAHDVGYLSNDRIAVSADSARAVPTVVALRPGTRAMLPDLVARLASAGDFREHAGERASRGPSPPSAWHDSWHVSPRQLCDALDRPLHGAAPLAAVAFVSPARGGRTAVRRLTDTEAAPLLLDALLCRRSRQYASDVFGGGPTPDDDAMTARCGMLAARVACFSVSMSEDPRPDDGGVVLRQCLP